MRRLTGDYPAALTGEQQALGLFRRLGDRLGQAWALDELGLVHQLAGDYPAATACLAEALGLVRDLGDRHGLSKALNSLGELSLRTSAAVAAQGQHAEALAIARELGTPAEEARALEGMGRSLCTGIPSKRPRCCGRPWRSTRRSGGPGPGSCRTLSPARAADQRGRSARRPPSARPAGGRASPACPARAASTVKLKPGLARPVSSPAVRSGAAGRPLPEGHRLGSRRFR